MNNDEKELKNAVIINKIELVEKKLPIVKSYYFKTNAGKKHDGITKTNQDNYITETNFLNLEDFSIFGILDGHGKLLV